MIYREIRKVLLFLSITVVLTATANAQNLSLDSCKQYALDNNKRLKEAHMRSNAASEVKKNAFTNYFPTIDAGAMVMKSSKGLIEAKVPEMNLPVYDGNPANLANPTQFTYFPGMNIELLDYVNAGMITAIQPVYAGGRIRNGNKLASLGEEFAGYQEHLTKDEILVTTEYYYWNLLALKEKKKTLNGYQQLLTSLLKDVTVSYNAGLIQKSDLLKVKLELNNIKTNRLMLDNGMTLLKMTMAQHIGIEYNENMSITDTIIDITPPADIFNNPDDALANRYEYRMLNRAVDAEILQKRMARGEFMPSLAVGAQGLYLDVADKKNSYGIMFATLSVPLSGWWGGSHKIKEHDIKVDIARNNLADKSELLKLQITKAYKDLIESYEQISVAEMSVDQANEHLNVVNDNYQAGIVSTSDLLEAQATYQSAKDKLVDAKTKYKIKKAEYLKTTAQIK